MQSVLKGGRGRRSTETAFYGEIHYPKTQSLFRRDQQNRCCRPDRCGNDHRSRILFQKLNGALFTRLRLVESIDTILAMKNPASRAQFVIKIRLETEKTEDISSSACSRRESCSFSVKNMGGISFCTNSCFSMSSSISDATISHENFDSEVRERYAPSHTNSPSSYFCILHGDRPQAPR